VCYDAGAASLATRGSVRFPNLLPLPFQKEKTLKKYLLVLAVLLASTAYAAQSIPGGTITFSGQIVPAQTGQQMTTITPEQTTDASGNSETLYVVSSAETGSTLATFTTLSAAQQYAAQVTPSVAYRSP
jgi:hypothetical protein